MAITHRDAPEYEWQRFGPGFVRRLDASHEWEPVPDKDVPAAVIAAFAEKQARKDLSRGGGGLSGGAKAKNL